MAQKDKELLIKDLCCRLPYGVIGRCEIDASYDTSFDTIFQIHKFDAVVYGLQADLLFVTPLIEDKDEQEFANEEVADGVYILDFKPYLFPLSSMTEVQKNIYSIYIDELKRNDGAYFETVFTSLQFWLYANHFDVHGLIPLDLAIDATGLKIYN